MAAGCNVFLLLAEMELKGEVDFKSRICGWS